MKIRYCLAMMPIFLVAGCQAVDGEWAPACTAFAGERLSLHEGRYRWDRFTDERRIDADGNVVDPFPDFPKSGAFEVDAGTVMLLDESGRSLATFHLHDRDGEFFLLTDDEQSALADGFPDCALKLAAGEQ